MRKLSLILASVILSSQLASAQSLDQYFHVQASQKAPQSSVLYIQTAKLASLKQTNAKAGTYQLTLTGVNPMVTYFSDRPTRVEGQIGNAVYLQTWNQGGKNSFDKDAPNAVVSGVAKLGLENKSVNIVMELSQPVIDTKHQTITYQAKALSSSESSLVLDAARLNFATVFIDGGVCTTCIIGG